MMFGKLIDVGIAKLCAMCSTPNYVDVFKNNASAGGSTQICYTAYGSGTISTTGGDAAYSEDTLTDVSHIRGLQMNGVAGPNGAIWVGINPVGEKVIDYNFIKGAQNLSFTGVKDMSILVCLRGEITANGKKMKDLTFAAISKDQTVAIDVPADCTAIVFWLIN